MNNVQGAGYRVQSGQRTGCQVQGGSFQSLVVVVSPYSVPRTPFPLHPALCTLHVVP